MWLNMCIIRITAGNAARSLREPIQRENVFENVYDGKNVHKEEVFLKMCIVRKMYTM